MAIKRVFLDKEGYIILGVSFAIAYCLPGSLVRSVEPFNEYVFWFMDKFKMLEYVANRSSDPNSYRLFFSIIYWLIPFFVVAYYKKPLKFDFSEIQKKKIFAVVFWLFLLPIFLFISVIGFQQEINDRTFYVVKSMMNAAAFSKIMLVLIFGGLVGFYSGVIAGIIIFVSKFREIVYGY